MRVLLQGGRDGGEGGEGGIVNPQCPSVLSVARAKSCPSGKGLAGI